MKWILEGVYLIVPKTVLNLLEWNEIEIRATGEKIIEIERLKAITEYYGDENCKAVKQFWEVLERFDNDQRQAYLKYVWGRSRIPVDCSNLQYKHTISVMGPGDQLPEAHTCFFQIDWPEYKDVDTAEKRLTTAIEFCGEIDGD